MMNKILVILIFVSPTWCDCIAQTSGALFTSASSKRIAVGSRPGSVAISDLNADGISDLIVANQGSDDVTILLGDGKGNLKPAKGSPFAAGNSPDDIAIADLNDDGELDLAFPNHDSKHVTLLLGDGQGAFAPAPNSPLTVKSEPHPHTIAVGDLNGDRTLDLIIDDWQNSKLTLLFGKGKGRFSTPGRSLAVPPIPYQNTRLSDMDGDGNQDIITPARKRNGVTVMLGDGKGVFKLADGAPFPAGRSPFNVAVGDINGDHKPDIAIARYSGSINDPSDDGIAILLGNGKGGFQPASGSPFDAGGAPVRVAAGDADGDGIDDVAVANLGSDDVTVLLGGKDGITVAPGSPFPVGRRPYAVTIGDLNGDGKSDLAVANNGSNDVTILFGR
jgi:hypothetical protein